MLLLCLLLLCRRVGLITPTLAVLNYLRHVSPTPTLTFSTLTVLVSTVHGYSSRPFQVADLQRAADTFEDIESMMQADIEAGTVRVQGGHTRNLLRVKRGLEFIRLLLISICEDRLVDHRGTA